MSIILELFAGGESTSCGDFAGGEMIVNQREGVYGTQPSVPL